METLMIIKHTINQAHMNSTCTMRVFQLSGYSYSDLNTCKQCIPLTVK